MYRKHLKINYYAGMGLLAAVVAFGGGCSDSGGVLEWRSQESAGSVLDQGIPDGFLPLPAGAAEAYSMEIRDVRRTGDFAFQTTRTADLRVSLSQADDPAAGRLVQVREMRAGLPGRVLFRAVTNPEGAVQGNLTVVSTARRAQLDFEHGGLVYAVPLDLKDLEKLDRDIRMNPAAAGQIDASSQPGVTAAALTDTDGDGVPDDADDFPTDASRATRVMFPTEGRYTVAFEDLYPNKGDADFNDYVIQARQEEHLNAAGDVVRILGSYRHVAKAAGYNHVLRLTLPIAAADYTITRYGADGMLASTTNHRAAPFEKIDITRRSDRTLGQSNAHPGQEFSPGELFEIEIVPDLPVAKADLGGAPYDLHLYVVSTGREVHFAGKFFDPDDGRDLYLDTDGFPWALLVPIDWRWMYETQDIFAAYEFFDDWYTSQGADNTDWYNFPDLDVVFGGVAGAYSATPDFLPPPGYNAADFVVSESLRPVPVRIDEDFIPLGAVYDIEPLSGGSVNFPGAPAEIRYTYDRDALLDAGLPENFTVFYYDAGGDAWLPVDETVADTANETVVARTSHLTPFVLAASAAAPEPEPALVRVNVRSDGSTMSGGGSYNAVSANGRYIAFQNLESIPGGSRQPCIFLRDVVTGNTRRISEAPDGSPANGFSYTVAISGDGRYVAFESLASNLVPGDTNGWSDVFLYDRITGVLSIVPNNFPARNVAISADGRYVVYEADDEVMLYDRINATKSLVSVASDGTPGNDGGWSPRISGDGRYVAFVSSSTNFVPADTTNPDVFVHDRVTGVTERVSVALDGGEPDKQSYSPSISADGRYVAFGSLAGNLVSGDTNAGSSVFDGADAFVYDRVTGQTSRVSVATDGSQSAGIAGSFPGLIYPVISADGTRVAFTSSYNDLVSGDTNGFHDLFIRDLTSGTTERLSLTADGLQANGPVLSSELSADGRYVVYASSATNLIPGLPGSGHFRIKLD